MDDIEAIFHEGVLSSARSDTTEVWLNILEMCRRHYPIGYRILDSFLSGPDIERRLELLQIEVPLNEWLRDELKDTLNLDQSADLRPEQLARLVDLVGVSGPR
jgi:hypothetical protein